jgi:hypothetical protein
MTARGQLFIEEECRDRFKVQLDREFGEEMWVLDGNEYAEVWDESDIPSVCEVPVWNCGDREFVIGYATIQVSFTIEGDGGGKHISVAPRSIKILKLERTKKNRGGANDGKESV